MQERFSIPGEYYLFCVGLLELVTQTLEQGRAEVFEVLVPLRRPSYLRRVVPTARTTKITPPGNVDHDDERTGLGSPS